MCSELKKAVVWSNYLNSQLNVLWRNAQECGDRDELKCQFYRALAFYRYSSSELESSEETAPIIEFDEPKLTFICNHSVVLTLTVKTGILTTDSAPITLDGRQALFRMSFTRTHIMGRDSKIDDQAADHEVRMVIFDYDRATLLPSPQSESTPSDENADAPDSSEPAVTTFFNAYLKFLRTAGHHVLFGFPDFTDQKVLASLPVNYALLHESQDVLDQYCSDITYFRITKEQIETYVTETQYERAESRVAERSDELAASIVRIRWTYQTTTYNIRFGVPIIKPLCPHEVLFIFNVTEVKENDQTEAVIENWTVAFVVNVLEFDGKHLKVDFRTARFTESLSVSLETFEEESLERSLITYLSTAYLDILVKHSYDVIFGPPEAERRTVLKDGGFWRRVHNVMDFFAVRRCGHGAIWLDRSQHVSLASLVGVRQAFALSERSIEYLLRASWKADKDQTYFSWDLDAFKGKFGPLRIHLLSNHSLIVFVDIQDLELVAASQTQSKQPTTRAPPKSIFLSQVNQNAGETDTSAVVIPSKFYKGLLAFEVDLKISVVSGSTEQYEFSLDVNNARHVEHLSDLWDTKTREKVNESTMTAVLRFVRNYIKYLESEKQTIVGKIFYQKPAEDETDQLTELSFHHKVVSEQEVTIESFLTSRLDSSDSSLVVILGVLTNTAVPNVPWSPGWLPSAESNGVGTVWISRDAFLEHVLKYLADFNAETTIVRQNDSGTDSFITLKARNEANKDNVNYTKVEAKWHPEQDSTLLGPEWMAYNWHYTYDASRREGTLIRQDLDSLLFRTENHLWIPTEATSNSNEIKLALTGEHQIIAAAKKAGVLLKKETFVTWQYVLTISSDSEGLTVTSMDLKDPAASALTEEGEKDLPDPYDAREKLQDRISDLVNTVGTELQEHLRTHRVHNWFDLDLNEYDVVNPIFTRGGDLVFEVYRKPEDAPEAE